MKRKAVDTGAVLIVRPIHVTPSRARGVAPVKLRKSASDKNCNVVGMCSASLHCPRPKQRGAILLIWQEQGFLMKAGHPVVSIT